ncbi:redox-sensitive transcriptional activator SoxR [Aliiruegeria lutimaris]|uniref:MerR family transcriptional regulator, redox-sensitive transcriptional activator SoxR n=1 Tax=Aliiruegeria lutimaris TaxID=571298 RepID=A0A1G8QLN9_9RHOB|nr:redox-sensitive transcriptional activator SoxR [Aliiruegeria lutimaris]SDJ05010.1 MerR family transcriptional regulator, redox-sensitive transcriptional activator SoxR [Aliiruegeria lutimaris]
MPLGREISIGQLAARTGLAVSAIRYYQAQGLISSERNAGGHRRFPRSVIRRLSFIRIAQQFGYSLDRIRAELASLPENRTPNQADWSLIAGGLRGELDAQIAGLMAMRDRLDGCIGCGCLSLEKCALYNPEDKAAKRGSGPRYLMGDSSDEI